MDLLYPALLCGVLLLSAAAGFAVRGRLHERHTARETVDSVRLLLSMLLTFAALVLGLLTSNAKQRFDGLNDSLTQFGADLVELDHRLRMYGLDGNPIRVELRRYTAGVLADSWPGETPPAGDYPREHGAPDRGLEATALGGLLTQVDTAVEQLRPTDDYHARIAARLRNRAADTIQQRWHLIFASRSTISWPFLLILGSMLTIVFAIFGLTTAPSRLIYSIVLLAALTIASPVYLIIEYSDALSGRLQLSSEPIRAALWHMDQ